MYYSNRKHCLISALLFIFIILCMNVAFCAEVGVKEEMTRVVEAVRPALIRIHVVITMYQQGRELKTEISGSGVIISSDGYAVTNHHVAGDAEHITCTLADKREVDAKLIGTDPLSDIAVIKLISPDGKPFVPAKFGDSSKLEVGDRVFAMGSPLALSQSVTMGIVSNTEMVMPDYIDSEDFRLEGEDVGSIVRWIGHDALIRGGNSGGPLVDRNGLVVGINEISFGLSGAIPSNLAKQVADQIIQNGRVLRSWLGVEIQPLLSSSNLTKGVMVSHAMKGTPGDKSGLKPGDILLSIDGKETTARFKEEVPVVNQLVAAIAVGKTVEAEVMRDGKPIILKITTEERPKAEDKEHEIKNWGICATNITWILQKELQLTSMNGVIVTGVLPSGPVGAAKPQLREGDVILKIGGEPVKDIADLRSKTKSIIDGSSEPVPVLIDFKHRKENCATVIKIGKQEKSTPGSEVRKAWLPIDTQVLTRELAKALGVPDYTGVRVTQIFNGNDAAAGGLRVGDLITKLDGEKIPADQIGDEDVLSGMIRQYDIDSDVVLGVIRDGNKIDIKVKLAASPKPSNEYPKYDNEILEFSARDIAFFDRMGGDVEKTTVGAYVEIVNDGGWASLARLRAGDVITEVDGKPVNGLEDLKQIMADIEKSKPKQVVLKIERGTHTMFLEIKPGWETPE